jgi:hypothetical protein
MKVVFSRVQVVCAKCGGYTKTAVRGRNTRCGRCNQPTQVIPYGQKWEGPGLKANQNDPGYWLSCGGRRGGCGTLFESRGNVGSSVKCPTCKRNTRIRQDAPRILDWDSGYGEEIKNLSRIKPAKVPKDYTDEEIAAADAHYLEHREEIDEQTNRFWRRKRKREGIKEVAPEIPEDIYEEELRDTGERLEADAAEQYEAHQRQLRTAMNVGEQLARLFGKTVTDDDRARMARMTGLVSTTGTKTPTPATRPSATRTAPATATREPRRQEFVKSTSRKTPAAIVSLPINGNMTLAKELREMGIPLAPDAFQRIGICQFWSTITNGHCTEPMIGEIQFPDSMPVGTCNRHSNMVRTAYQKAARER